jgi:hypothetical protein
MGNQGHVIPRGIRVIGSNCIIRSGKVYKYISKNGKVFRSQWNHEHLSGHGSMGVQPGSHNSTAANAKRTSDRANEHRLAQQEGGSTPPAETRGVVVNARELE